jgi:hypothetical protein
MGVSVQVRPSAPRDRFAFQHVNDHTERGRWRWQRRSFAHGSSSGRWPPRVSDHISARHTVTQHASPSSAQRRSGSPSTPSATSRSTPSSLFDVYPEKFRSLRYPQLIRVVQTARERRRVTVNPSPHLPTRPPSHRPELHRTDEDCRVISGRRTRTLTAIPPDTIDERVQAGAACSRQVWSPEHSPGSERVISSPYRLCGPSSSSALRSSGSTDGSIPRR